MAFGKPGVLLKVCSQMGSLQAMLSQPGSDTVCESINKYLHVEVWNNHTSESGSPAGAIASPVLISHRSSIIFK